MTSEGNPMFVPVEPEARSAIADILYRFAAGQDLKDRALFQSAFAIHSELDFTQPARLMEVELPVFRGRDEITNQVMTATAELATTHTVTNMRITSFEGQAAGVFALVEAQHLPRSDHSRHLLLKNLYFVDVIFESHIWVARSIRIHNVWRSGDPKVLFPSL